MLSVMADPAKRRVTKTYISARINTLVFEKLKKLEMTTGRTRSELVDRAIEEFLERQEQRQADQKPPERRPRH